ncbi:MAG: outer membrane lipoprotein carrier protein LolA [Bacteroidota bacterium]
MKKLIVLLIASCFCSLQLSAQDTKAKAILDGVVAQTKLYSTIDIAFSYKMENKTKKINESKSGVATMKGDKYWLEFAGQQIMSDGKTVWTYIKESNEVQINNNNPNDDQTINPAKLLTGYNKSFTPKFIKEETRGAIVFQIIDLTPLKARSYFKMRVEIDKAKKQIVNAIVYDKNGTTVYTYTVTKFVTNKVVADTKFVFKATDHPGVEVIDLR